jgi:hypothetical protein
VTFGREFGYMLGSMPACRGENRAFLTNKLDSLQPIRRSPTMRYQNLVLKRSKMLRSQSWVTSLAVLTNEAAAQMPDSPPLACKEASMARSNLRIYRGPNESHTPVLSASKAEPATVTMDLKEVLPLLADAVASRRTWLSDFEDDQITISADLYEVLLAYQYYRHPAA